MAHYDLIVSKIIISIKRIKEEIELNKFSAAHDNFSHEFYVIKNNIS